MLLTQIKSHCAFEVIVFWTKIIF